MDADLSLDAVIAKRNIGSFKAEPKAGQKSDGPSMNSTFKKRKSDDLTVEVDNSGPKGSTFGAACGQIFVENLKFEVTDDDLNQLFSAFGTLKRAAVNYQKDGRSAGTAFVVFDRKSDAKTCVDNLQGVTLDGRALRLIPVESSASSQASNGLNMTARVKRQAKEWSGGARQMWSDMAAKYDDSPTEQLKGYRKPFSRSEDKSKEKEAVSVQDLDADLESYLAQRNKSQSPSE